MILTGYYVCKYMSSEILKSEFRYAKTKPYYKSQKKQLKQLVQNTEKVCNLGDSENARASDSVPQRFAS